MSEKNNKNLLNFSQYTKIRNHSLSSNYSSQKNLPVEILYKIFDRLNIIDLIKCSKVCKKWNEVSNLKYFWIKWSTNYGFNLELTELIKSKPNFLPKQLFIKILNQKRDLYLFKQYNKITKKLNVFSYLPDLNYQSIKDQVLTWQWYLEFYDKKNKTLFSLRQNEINLFESSFSILWYSNDLNQLVDKYSKDIHRLRLLVEVPIYIDLISGKFVINRRTILNINENNRKCVYDLEIDNFKQFKFKQQDLNNFYQDSIIKLAELKRNLLLGLWKSSNEISFMSFNSIFDFNLIHKIFGADINAPKKSTKIKSTDYTIYLNIHNQTKTSFLRLNKTTHKSTSIKLNDTNKKDFIKINILDSNMINDIGPQLIMMPKFTWKTEIMAKNDIELVALFDLCLFDSDRNLILSECFPIKLNEKNNTENQFLTNDSYEAIFKCDDFIIECLIISLKDEYTNSSNNISYHMKRVDLYLPIKP